MSKHHYAATVREIQDLVTAVINVPVEDWDREHGISLLQNKKICDLVDGQIYSTLTDWARASIEANSNDYEVGMENQRTRFDDE